MTRVRVIPKRGLRPWEPVVWGALYGFSLYFLQRVDYPGSPPYWFIELLNLVPAVLFIYMDARQHRRFARLACRAVVLVLVALVANTLLGDALDTRSAIGIVTNPWRHFFSAMMLVPVGIGVAIAAFLYLSTRIVFGIHVYEPENMCWNCCYDRSGLSGDAPCPECGTPPRTHRITKNRLNQAIFAGATVVSILITAWIVFSIIATLAPIYRPIREFTSVMPNHGTNFSHYTYWPGITRDDARRTIAITRFVDITSYTPPAPTTHISATLILSPDPNAPRIQIQLGSLLQTGSKFMQWHFYEDVLSPIFHLSPEAAERFISNGGFNDEQIKELLKEQQKNWRAYSRQQFIDLDWPETNESP